MPRHTSTIVKRSSFPQVSKMRPDAQPLCTSQPCSLPTIPAIPTIPLCLEPVHPSNGMLFLVINVLCAYLASCSPFHWCVLYHACWLPSIVQFHFLSFLCPPKTHSSCSRYIDESSAICRPSHQSLIPAQALPICPNCSHLSNQCHQVCSVPNWLTLHASRLYHADWNVHCMRLPNVNQALGLS